MGNIFFALYCLLYILLMAYTYRLHAAKDLQHTLLLLLMAGLLYDNFISCTGFLVGDGALLKGLNIVRYVIHAFATPLLCYIVFIIARKMGVNIFQSSVFEAAIWILVTGFMLLGYRHELASMDFVPKIRWGVLNYVHAVSSPPLAAILINVFVLVTAIFIWRATRWPVLFISSLLMFVFAAIPMRNAPPILGNAGEIIFMYGFVLAEKRLTDIRHEQVVEKVVFHGLVKNIQMHGRAKARGMRRTFTVRRNDEG